MSFTLFWGHCITVSLVKLLILLGKIKAYIIRRGILKMHGITVSLVKLYIFCALILIMAMV